MLDVLNLHDKLLYDYSQFIITSKIISLSMNLRSMWIMSPQTLHQFNQQRFRCYQNANLTEGIPQQSHDQLLKTYIHNLVKFLRGRKHQSQFPFKQQKVYFISVMLLKRFYLVNTFIGSDPIQNMACAIYVSFKLNQYDENDIKRYSQKWRKKEFFSLHQIKHIGDQGYTQIQADFLKGIHFQIGFSKLIQPLQSLYHILSEDKSYLNTIDEIREYLFKVYLQQKIIFTRLGPQIAMAIVLSILRHRKIQITGILEDLYKGNSQEIDQIIEQLGNVQKFSPSEDELKSIKRLKKIAMNHKPKFPKPEPRQRRTSSMSPRFPIKNNSNLQE